MSCLPTPPAVNHEGCPPSQAQLWTLQPTLLPGLNTAIRVSWSEASDQLKITVSLPSNTTVFAGEDNSCRGLGVGNRTREPPTLSPTPRPKSIELEAEAVDVGPRRRLPTPVSGLPSLLK